MSYLKSWKMVSGIMRNERGDGIILMGFLWFFWDNGVHLNPRNPNQSLRLRLAKFLPSRGLKVILKFNWLRFSSIGDSDYVLEQKLQLKLFCSSLMTILWYFFLIFCFKPLLNHQFISKSYSLQLWKTHNLLQNSLVMKNQENE